MGSFDTALPQTILKSRYARPLTGLTLRSCLFSKEKAILFYPLISKTTLYSPPGLHRLYHPHFALSCSHVTESFPHRRSSTGIPNIHHAPRRLLYTSRSTLPSFQGNVALDVARMLLASPDILAQTTTSLPPCWTPHIVLPFATYLYQDGVVRSKQPLRQRKCGN